MKAGDIIWLPEAQGAEMRASRARILGMTADEAITLEYIEGPRDGEKVSFTREALDQIMEAEGGEDWKRGPA